MRLEISQQHAFPSHKNTVQSYRGSRGRRRLACVAAEQAVEDSGVKYTRTQRSLVDCPRLPSTLCTLLSSCSYERKACMGKVGADRRRGGQPEMASVVLDLAHVGAKESRPRAAQGNVHNDIMQPLLIPTGGRRREPSLAGAEETPLLMCCHSFNYHVRTVPVCPSRRRRASGVGAVQPRCSFIEPWRQCRGWKDSHKTEDNNGQCAVMYGKAWHAGVADLGRAPRLDADCDPRFSAFW